eukprot:TRINITY_DN68981_c0_g1_i1.p1 TRINITY_DN68981_c0_g1~~TRINITY_DN68981_c0_g1_i1.p1  ORF type:complete len:599 (-),score=130.42 TRINITY_DN68981_c0_g1_i1:100-1896(-)
MPSLEVESGPVERGKASCDALALLADVSGRESTCEPVAAVEALLLFAPPRVASGVAVFGLGIGALPLLGRLASPASAAASSFSYEGCSSDGGGGAAAAGPSHEPGLFTAEELRGRLGHLDPKAVAAELQMDALEVSKRCCSISPSVSGDAASPIGSSPPSSTLSADVKDLQEWQREKVDLMTCLERRSALAFLGLGADADAEAVQRSYKQRALLAHPDKGGSEEEFHELQSALGRLQQEASGAGKDGGKNGNFFEELKKVSREMAEKANDLSDDLKLRQNRIRLHDQAVELRTRAQAVEQTLAAGQAGAPKTGRMLALLRRFVAGFEAEIESLPHATAASAVAGERLVCRFVRQGLEVLTAAALTDAHGTVAHVALHFTGPLLRAVGSSSNIKDLEKRCRALLAALGEVPDDFDRFMTRFEDGLHNRNAADWRGCAESREPAHIAPAPEPDKPPARVCPFAAAVASAAAAAQGGPATFRSEAAPAIPANSASASGTVLAKQRVDEAQVQVCPKPSATSQAYHATEEWRKLRAYCIRHRFCVNFNRDAADIRCNDPGACSFSHACAVCGEKDKGGPGSQYASHGGWNCSRLTAWLMAHR